MTPHGATETPLFARAAQEERHTLPEPPRVTQQQGDERVPLRDVYGQRTSDASLKAESQLAKRMGEVIKVRPVAVTWHVMTVPNTITSDVKTGRCNCAASGSSLEK